MTALLAARAWGTYTLQRPHGFRQPLGVDCIWWSVLPQRVAKNTTGGNRARVLGEPVGRPAAG